MSVRPELRIVDKSLGSPLLRTKNRSTVRFRRAKSSDFPGISKCYWIDPEVPWDLYSKPKLLKRLVGPRGFIVAEADGRVAGFIHYRVFRKSPWFDPSVKVYGQVLELHVKDRFQGKGIGRHLMMEAIARLEAGGCRVIYTHTDETNSRSMKLYTRLGFKPFLRTFYLKRHPIPLRKE